MKYILDHAGKPNYRFFEEISAIPRNSFQEEKISDYLVKFAEDRGLWRYRDDIWNVIIKKPASKGYEDHPPVMLQGHTDMVCEKISGSSHNFDTDPLELYVEDGWLKAKGTTLGADCGDGVANMLAVLDDTTLKHPPIEAFFSVQEESGIGGPRLVDYSQFTAKRIIATDIIWEGTTYESVSGAIGGDFIKKINRKEIKQPVFALSVSNCTGGHSALNACKCPANAIKAVGRILFRIKKAAAINLIDLEGGSIRNNIASDCRAVFAYKEENEQEIWNLVKEAALELEKEYSFTDPEMQICLEAIPDDMEALTVQMAALDAESSNSMIDLIHVLPSGEYIRN
ncbi:MAG: peptidase dimerization domain-containing protein, partial [Bacillota bacterium]